MPRQFATTLAAILAVTALGAPALVADDAGAPPADRGRFVAQRAPQVLYENGNLLAVYTHPERVAVFDLRRRSRITRIMTYHWNDARGARPGWIALIDSAGELYGPWRAVGSPGQGGVPNAYWTVTPNVTVPAGRYLIVDSDPLTWAHNAGSGGAGIVRVEGTSR